MKLPLDITRCTNTDCKESLSCKRRVAIFDDDDNDIIWYARFEEKDCKFKLEIDEHRTRDDDFLP
jgi:hypothetical protein